MISVFLRNFLSDNPIHKVVGDIPSFPYPETRYMKYGFTATSASRSIKRIVYDRRKFCFLVFKGDQKGSDARRRDCPATEAYAQGTSESKGNPDNAVDGPLSSPVINVDDVGACCGVFLDHHTPPHRQRLDNIRVDIEFFCFAE